MFKLTSITCSAVKSMPFILEQCVHIKIGKLDEKYLVRDNTIESVATQNFFIWQIKINFAYR